MIRIECDNCERTFEVDPAKVTDGKVPCPLCGDVNRVPEEGSAEASGLPPDSGPEREILNVHPAMFRAHPFRGMALVLLGAGGATLAIWGFTADGKAFLGWLGVIAFLAAVAWWVVWLVSSHFWVKLAISNKRTVRHEGIVRRHTSEVLHDHVRNVEIRQSFLQRILKVGYLGISSSGQEGIEIEVHDLPKPYELKALIDQYRNM